MADKSYHKMEPLLGKETRLSIDDDTPTPDFKEFPPLIVVPPRWLIIAFLFCVCLVSLFLTVLSEHVGLGSHEDKIKFIKYASVPVISVGFTYFHIWLALWMTFYPIKFFGILQIPGTNVGMPGWQGIVPQKAEKMARISVRLMTTKLIDMKKEFQKIDAKIFAAQVFKNMLFIDVLHSLILGAGCTDGRCSSCFFGKCHCNYCRQISQRLVEERSSICQRKTIARCERTGPRNKFAHYG